MKVQFSCEGSKEITEDEDKKVPITTAPLQTETKRHSSPRPRKSKSNVDIWEETEIEKIEKRYSFKDGTKIKLTKKLTPRPSYCTTVLPLIHKIFRYEEQNTTINTREDKKKKKARRKLEKIEVIIFFHIKLIQACHQRDRS